jgi:hypothetical protein
MYEHFRSLWKFNQFETVSQFFFKRLVTSSSPLERICKRENYKGNSICAQESLKLSCKELLMLNLACLISLHKHKCTLHEWNELKERKIFLYLRMNKQNIQCRSLFEFSSQATYFTNTFRFKCLIIHLTLLILLLDSISKIELSFMNHWTLIFSSTRNEIYIQNDGLTCRQQNNVNFVTHHN